MTYLTIALSANRLGYFRQDKSIFRNINFNLYNSRILLLVGPNGSGKSTLLKIIAGFIDADEGNLNVKHNNATLSGNKIQECIHFIPDLLNFKEDLDVYDHLFYWSYLYAPDKCAIYHNSNVLNALNFMNLNGKIFTKIRYLSFGQRKKLTLSKLLLTNRPIWLLDEPTIGLDSESISFLQKLIRLHQKNNGITILSSHSNIKLQDVDILEMG